MEPSAAPHKSQIRRRHFLMIKGRDRERGRGKEREHKITNGTTHIRCVDKEEQEEVVWRCIDQRSGKTSLCVAQGQSRWFSCAMVSRNINWKSLRVFLRTYIEIFVRHTKCHTTKCHAGLLYKCWTFA